MSEQTETKPYINHFKKKNKNFKNNKKKFLSNAKSFARKGNFGRGTHIEEEDFTYFIEILEILKKTPPSIEERTSMANNVMEQTKGKEIHLASNQIASRPLDTLMGFTDAEHLERFFEVFGESLRPICSDVFASHVLEKMVETALLRAVGKDVIDLGNEDGKKLDSSKRPKLEIVTDLKFNQSTEFTEDHRANCSKFVERVSMFLLNNLEDFVWDRCGSHLIRSCVLSLAGIHIPKQMFSNKKVIDQVEKTEGTKNGHQKGILTVKDMTVFKVPSKWLEIMKEFPSRLEMWPQFSELPYDSRSAGLLQVICFALSIADVDTLETFGKQLLKKTLTDISVPKNSTEFNNAVIKIEDNNVKTEINDGNNEEIENDGPSVFQSHCSLRLLKTLITVASPKLLSKIYKRLFADQMLKLASNENTFFAAERLINYIQDKAHFETIFDELCVHFEEFIHNKKMSLLTAFSGACLRLKTKQAAYITTLQSALQCSVEKGTDRPKSFFPCLVKMKTFDDLKNDLSGNVSMFGSLIIQDILHFNKPIFLVNCILETPVNDLVSVIQTPNGGYIVDAFLNSSTIGEKNREKLVKHFESFYMDLALGRCGSRVLEELFKAANDVQKVQIAKKLTSQENKLKGNVFGRIIYNLMRLETFKLSQEQWKNSWSPKEAKEEGKKKKDKKRSFS